MPIPAVVTPFAIIGLFAIPPVAMALWPSDDSAVVVFTERGRLPVADDAVLVTTTSDYATSVLRAREGRESGFVRRLFATGARLVLAAPDDAGCTTTEIRALSSNSEL